MNGILNAYPSGRKQTQQREALAISHPEKLDTNTTMHHPQRVTIRVLTNTWTRFYRSRASSYSHLDTVAALSGRWQGVIRGNVKTDDTAGKQLLNQYRTFSTSHNGKEGVNATPTALVLGSSGALGSAVAYHLSQDLGMRVIGADVMELPPDLSPGWELDGFITCDPAANISDLTVNLVQGMDFYLREFADKNASSDRRNRYPGLDAIICANGGWEPDPDPVIRTLRSVGDEDEDNAWRDRLVQGAIEHASTIDNMMRKNLFPVTAASYVAQYFLNPSSLMVVMGATAALTSAPGMLGYGLAKNASHYLVQTLGASTGQSLETKPIRKSGRQVRKHLPSLDDLTVVGILPTMIDTTANRKANPGGDFNEWTKPAQIAQQIGEWIVKPLLRPHSGSLVKVYPKDGNAIFEIAR